MEKLYKVVAMKVMINGVTVMLVAVIKIIMHGNNSMEIIRIKMASKIAKKGIVVLWSSLVRFVNPHHF